MGAFLTQFLLLFTVAASAADGQSCENAIAPSVPIISEVVSTATAPKSARVHEVEMDLHREESILEILKMWGQLRDHENGYSEKKKTVTLANKLSGGYKLEMTYEKDSSDDAVVYNYVSLDLIHPGGFKENLSKRPVNDKTWKFAQEYYSFDGPVGQFEVVTPIRLEGNILNEVKKWGERLEFIDPMDLRNLTSMSELNSLYFKYFKASQKNLHITGTIKGYSKILFNVATLALISYFTVSKYNEAEKVDASEFFLLILKFKGEQTFGLSPSLQVIEGLEKDGPPAASKEFVDPEPRVGQSRVITVSEYTNVISVLEMTYERGQAVDANVVLVPREAEIFKVLARALRSK